MSETLTPQADEVIKAYQHCVDSYENSTEESEENMRYVINEPYSDEEQSTAEKYNKPLLKYNILIPALLTIVGNEQLYKRKAVFKTRDRKSADIVEFIQGRWEAIIDEETLEEKLQTVLFDALIANKGGWLQRNITLNSDGYLDFSYEVANNMRVFPDPETLANDYMLDKSRYIVKETWLPADEVIDTYDLKGVASALIKSEIQVNWYDKLQKVVRRFTDRDYSTNLKNIYNIENDRVLVLELQKKTNRTVYRCYNAEGQYSEHPTDEFEDAKREDPSLKIIDTSTAQVVRRTICIPYFGNVTPVEEDIDQPFPKFDMFNVFSYAFNVPLPEIPSLIGLLKDIQDDVNKSMSQKRDLVTQLLGGGFFIDKREDEAIKLLQEEAGKTNLVVPLKNPQVKPERFHPGNVPAEVMMTADGSLLFADRITLISSAMRGESQKSGESGALYQKKIERATAAINPYFKNLSNMRYALAVDFIDNFGSVYSEIDRPATIKNREGNLQDVIFNLEIMGEVMNDVRNPSLYVELDEGEQNVTIKEENFEKLLAIYNLIIQANPAAASRLVKVLVEEAPIKNVDKFIQILDSELEQQRQGNAQAEALDTAKQALENKKIESEINNPATREG